MRRGSERVRDGGMEKARRRLYDRSSWRMGISILCTIILWPCLTCASAETRSNNSLRDRFPTKVIAYAEIRGAREMIERLSRSNAWTELTKSEAFAHLMTQPGME